MKKLILILCFIIIYPQISCFGQKIRINLDSILSKHLSSQHFNYFMSEGDDVDTVFQEKYYDWLVSKLAIDVKEKINFYKFKDRKHMKETINYEINGFAIAGTNNIYGVWQTDNHELVHSIVMKNVGMSYALFNEGIAVAHTAVLRDSVFVLEAGGADINLISKYNYKNGKMPDLDTLIGLQTLREIDDLITYTAAGSFISFLINNYGIEKLKDFILKSHYRDIKNELYNKMFFSVYNMTLTKAWSDWLTYLDDYQSSIDYNKYFQDWMERRSNRKK